MLLRLITKRFNINSIRIIGVAIKCEINNSEMLFMCCAGIDDFMPSKLEQMGLFDSKTVLSNHEEVVSRAARWIKQHKVS